MTTSEQRIGRAIAAIDRAYQRPPLVWLTRFFQWFSGWRWSLPVTIAVVVIEWAALYAMGVLD